VGGTDDIDVASSGVYTGTKTKTYTLTTGAAVGGGAWQPTDYIISWDDGDGNAGQFQIGSNWYTAGDDITVGDEGLLLQMTDGGGTDIGAADTCTIVCTARAVLDPAHAEIAGDSAPVDVHLTGLTEISTDIVNRTYDGEQRRVARANLMAPAVYVDYLDGANLERILRMKAERQLVTLAENYDQYTKVLWRGRGLTTFLGTYPTYTRSGAGYDQDPVTGRHRIIAADTMRQMMGPEQSASSESNGYERVWWPSKWSHTGAACVLNSEAVTNLLGADMHPKSGTLGWTGTGAAGVSWTTGRRGVLDPDSTWGKEYAQGVCQVELTGTGDTVYSDTETATGGQPYSGGVWIRGSGALDVQLMEGTTTPPTTAYVTQAVTLTDDRWQWVPLVPAAAIAGGSNKVGIRIRKESGTTTGPAQFFLSSSSINLGYFAHPESFITNNAEVLTFNDPLPPVGTISFWYCHGGDDGTNTVDLIESSSAPNYFLIQHDSSGNQIIWFTDSAGALGGACPDLKSNAWYHVAATWDHEDDSGVDKLRRRIYLDGSELSNDLTTNFNNADWGATWTMIQNPAALNGQNCGIAEIRLDTKARTATEVATMYDRLVDDKLLALHRSYGGRKFHIEDVEYTWLHVSQPDKYLVTATLAEAGREADSLVTTA
jgi:hypothetical protein